MSRRDVELKSFQDVVEEVPRPRRKEDDDARELEQLGYRQQLNRTFGFMSSLGLTTTVMATWEAYTVIFQIAMFNGGPVALVYGFMFCFLGTLCTCASLAEYASMSPTSAAQYRWAAELAPKKWFRGISWVLGWITFWGWQLTTASPAYLGATIIQALLMLNYPTYVFERWHGTLLYWAVIALGVVVNVGFAKWLPKLEGFLFIWHIVGFFCVLIPLVYLGPRNTAEFVFTSTIDTDYWPNYGIAFCIGVTVNTFPFVGYDAAAHMSEEVKEPTVVIPRAMIGTILVNGLMGFGMILALLFSMGDINEVLANPISTVAGYPFVVIYYNATQSLAGTNAMTSVSLVIVIMAHFGLMAGCSRTTWAFARDRGLPGSRWLDHVGQKSQVPSRAIALSVVIQVLLGLINIGSYYAFSAFVNAAAVTLYVTYIAPVILGLMKRMRGEHIPYGPFQLGRLRTPVNLFAIVYTAFVSFFLLWPAVADTNATYMNWSVLLIGGIVVISGVWWLIDGRKNYVGPNIEATLHRNTD